MKSLYKEVVQEVDTTVENNNINAYQNQYNYGQTQEQLRPGIEVEGGFGKFKNGNFLFSTTGNIPITGIGFKPKLVKFTVYEGGGLGIGSMTDTFQQSTALYGGYSNILVCIKSYNSAGIIHGEGRYVSMDSDGFTINITIASGINVNVQYECYG